MKQIEKAAEKYALECQREEGYPSPMYDSYDAKDMRECAFKSGAEWQANQNPWRNFKDERPKPNSHILRKMIHPDYKSYDKTLYYADFWGEDRSDKWVQDNGSVVYEWKYINQ